MTWRLKEGKSRFGISVLFAFGLNVFCSQQKLFTRLDLESTKAVSFGLKTLENRMEGHRTVVTLVTSFLVASVLVFVIPNRDLNQLLSVTDNF